MAANVIGQAIVENIASSGFCNVMLTGGRTAGRLYQYWTSSRDLQCEAIRFFIGDERCVPSEHPESNYGGIRKALDSDAVSMDWQITRMHADSPDREGAAREYESLLPRFIDVLLLGLGLDGHVASLFPYSLALSQTGRRVVPVVGPYHPFARLTITPQVIAQARSVFLLATGEEKGQVLARALKSPMDISESPVRLTFDGTWLLDAAAKQQLP